MKNAFLKNKNWILLALAVFLVFGGNWFNQVYLNYEKADSLKSFKAGLLKAENKARILLDSLNEHTFDENKAAFTELENEFLPYGISFFIYNDDSLKLWSNIEALPPFYFREFYRPTYHKTDNGSYLFWVKSNGDKHSVVSINLVHHYLFSNKYLIDNSPIYNDFAENYKIGKPDEYTEKIAISSGQVIASVSQKQIKSKPEFLSYFTLFLLLVILYSQSASIYTLLATVALYLIGRNVGAISVLNQGLAYDASLYAGLLNCFADLLVVVFVLNGLTRVTSNSRLKKLIYYALSVILSVVIHDLVVNSTITLDTSNTLKLSVWSLLSFIIFGVLINVALNAKEKFDKKEDLILFALSLIVSISLIVFLKLNWGLVAINLVFYLLNFSNYKSYSSAGKKLVFGSLIAVIAFVNVEYLTLKKEQNKLPLIVKKHVNKRDNIAEFLLSDFRKNLLNDAYVSSFFSNTLLPKSVVEERISKLYLRGYLKKFEHQVVYAPKKIKLGITPDYNLVSQINEIMQDQENEIVEGLYTTKVAGIANTYLTELHYKGETGDTIGSMYVLLNEKSFYDQSIYPELLIDESSSNTDADLNFAYYKGNELLNTGGVLSYPLFKKSKKSDFEKLLDPDYNHLFYTPDTNTVFVVSLKKRSWFNYASSFSIFVFLIISFSFLFLYAKAAIKNIFSLKRLWFSTTFSNRIRFSSLATVFIALVLLAFATNAYTQAKYEQKTLESLVAKANKAKLYFSNIFTEAKNLGPSTDNLQESVLQFSELYESDIDLFNAAGQLRASSQKILYENGILEGQLDGTAFFEIAYNGKSLFIKDEKIGKLNYISAFVPVIKNGDFMGFVQLPYFKRQQDLRKDQANFVVTLFNIYLIILLLLAFLTALILRTVTKPLSLITTQLKNTTLTSTNEKITWEKNDEIGLLVKEYNQMVDKLELSAKQLADSKQAEAWQEMAKQVAHEIKNPLTPMKLNIQQLQRAWKDQHPNVENIFNKVTQVLISQIESLARIASNFSNFAKMPKVETQPVSIGAILNEIEQLYNSKEPVVFLKNPYADQIVMADRDQLFRAINNLVKNGIQAVDTPIKPVIKIFCECVDSKLKLTITDNGSGISEEMKEKIFIPNFSTKSSGMGLGLAIVKQIVESHNGSIYYKSNVPVGTTFIIEIPLNSTSN
ncbi:MAG: GHKL domain-containing protein [Bacteroidia bacterium]